jgi:transcriptional regulator with XRE-family HTH domain
MVPGRAVECLMEDIGLSKKELADALETTPRTLERWRSGETYPRRDTRRRLATLIELDRHLRDTFEDRGATRRWLGTPHQYLVELTPVEAVRVGRVDRVEPAFEALDSGVFI